MHLKAYSVPATDFTILSDCGMEDIGVRLGGGGWDTEDIDLPIGQRLLSSGSTLDLLKQDSLQDSLRP